MLFSTMLYKGRYQKLSIVEKYKKNDLMNCRLAVQLFGVALKGPEPQLQYQRQSTPGPVAGAAGRVAGSGPGTPFKCISRAPSRVRPSSSCSVTQSYARCRRPAVAFGHLSVIKHPLQPVLQPAWVVHMPGPNAPRMMTFESAPTGLRVGSIEEPFGRVCPAWGRHLDRASRQASPVPGLVRQWGDLTENLRYSRECHKTLIVLPN
jgi:hypothetical protein